MNEQELREQIAQEIEQLHKEFIEADFTNSCDISQCDHISDAAIARGK